jgi:hypothetical protein
MFLDSSWFLWLDFPRSIGVTLEGAKYISVYVLQTAGHDPLFLSPFIAVSFVVGLGKPCLTTTQYYLLRVAADL